MIAKGIIRATYSEMYYPYAHEMGVIHVAHGTELLLKARIAEVDPWFMFTDYPGKITVKDDQNLEHLLENGKTHSFSKLPVYVGEVTGYKIVAGQDIIEFGRIRNRIVHAGIATDICLSDATLRFAFEVLEPLVDDWWDTSLFESMGNYYEGEQWEYTFERLKELGIESIYKLDDNGDLARNKKA